MREALRWLDRNTTEQGTFGTAAPKRLIFGTPGAIRTRDLLLRRQTLYPAELRAHKETLLDSKPIPGCTSIVIVYFLAQTVSKLHQNPFR